MQQMSAKLVAPITRLRAPKQIARREDVARAAYSVIARDGLDGTSMRAIASEMGCSTGVLTHHFRDKAELIKFILDTLVVQISQQIADAGGMTGADPLPRMLLAMLPHDAETELRWRVVSAFTVASMNEPTLREDQERREAIIHDWYEETVIDLQNRGLVRKDVDPKRESAFMSCLVDGLATHTLLSPERYTQDLQKALVAQYVASIS